MLDFLWAILLGIVQALTEFLPISSSAHLLLIRQWIGLDAVDGLTFDVALHIGTLAALIMYFRRDIAVLAIGFRGSLGKPRSHWTSQERLPWYILAATIPAGLFGLLLGDGMLELLRQPRVVIVTLVLGGILFLIFERMASQTKRMENLKLQEGLLIGFAQALALVPGVSRSGITILAGMSIGLKRDEAARFAFLLGVPIMAVAGIKKALDVRGLSLDVEQIGILAVGIFTSMLVGWLVIKYLLRFLHNHRLDVFAYYRFALAVVVFLWLLF